MSRQGGVEENVMRLYFDRDGQPMTMDAWARSFKKTDRCVAATSLPDGKWVSTVWVGLDHSFGGGPPLIFETMVFPSQEDMGDLDCARYTTLAEAQAGHDAMVAKWTSAPQADA